MKLLIYFDGDEKPLEEEDRTFQQTIEAATKELPPGITIEQAFVKLVQHVVEMLEQLEKGIHQMPRCKFNIAGHVYYFHRDKIRYIKVEGGEEWMQDAMKFAREHDVEFPE